MSEAEPKGISKQDLFKQALTSTQDFPVDEVIGQAGDVILIHPFTVHPSSPNTSDRVRIAAN